MSNHNCTKLVSKLFLALDGELSTDEEKEFLAELEECSYCLEQFNIEKAFKQFLHDKIAKKQVQPATIADIKSKIKELTLA